MLGNTLQVQEVSVWDEVKKEKIFKELGCEEIVKNLGSS